jgi:hypothetical protein
MALSWRPKTQGVEVLRAKAISDDPRPLLFPHKSLIVLAADLDAAGDGALVVQLTDLTASGIPTTFL